MTASPPTGSRDFAHRLGPLGVPPRSEDVYRRVLADPGRRIEELAAELGGPEDEVRRSVGDLTRLRLVRVTAGVVVAEAPELALRDLVQTESARLVEAQTALSQARLAVPDLIAESRTTWPVVPEGQGVETLSAVEGFQALIDLCLRTDGDLAFLRSDQWVGDAYAAIDDLVVEQVAAGRVSRAIYPVHVLEQVPVRVRARAEAGEQVRVLPEVGSRLVVFGTTAAVTTEHWGSTAGARLVVRQHGLVLAMRALFDALWARAVVPPGLVTEAVEDERRQLLALMLEGAIDQQIARATGVSVRTVRRRIASLMDELGATSRFGAGVEAARRGWL